MLDHPGKDIYSIVGDYGLTIHFEQPISGNPHIRRISEYRPKSKSIVIFFRENEAEAVAHELFHHLETLCDFSLSKQESELNAKDFASEISSLLAVFGSRN